MYVLPDNPMLHPRGSMGDGCPLAWRKCLGGRGQPLPPFPCRVGGTDVETLLHTRPRGGPIMGPTPQTAEIGQPLAPIRPAQNGPSTINPQT